MNPNSSNKKAKDILSELTHREPVGDRLLIRIGHRFWGRLNVAIPSRFFEIHDIPDPYQPEGFDSKWRSKLGPVSLRLGENRRKPAPHLTVREPKNASNAPKVGAQFRPKGIPEAPSRPSPPPIPKPSPAVSTTAEQKIIPKGNAVVKAPPKQSSEFRRNIPKPKAPPIPIRPDIIQKLIEKGVPLPPHLQAQYDAMKAVQKAPSVADEAPHNTGASSEPLSKKPSRQEKSRSGRMRFKAQRRQGPIVTPVSPSPAPEPSVIPPQPEPLRPPPAVTEEVPNRTPPSNPNNLSLDDLFGFSGQERIRVGRPKRKKVTPPKKED